MNCRQATTCGFSPYASASVSTTVDFPDPFSPTSTVSPAGSSDLNPLRVTHELPPGHHLRVQPVRLGQRFHHGRLPRSVLAHQHGQPSGKLRSEPPEGHA